MVKTDRMVNVFFQATICSNVFSMVLPRLNHHDWMFFEGPTIGFSEFSMVFDILTEMVNDGRNDQGYSCHNSQLSIQKACKYKMGAIEENNDFPLTN